MVVCELAEPLTVRRTVSLSSAIDAGEFTVEGIVGRRTEVAEAASLALTGIVPVVVSPTLPEVGQDVVVDARLAKRNIDTALADARLVVSLGPGFSAGFDCHAVIETNRGHRLGRVLWHGSADADTGTPGLVAGRAVERVLRSPATGMVVWHVAIGAIVDEGDTIGRVESYEIRAPFSGLVRGLIRDGQVRAAMKVGDIDARLDPSMCHEISDKALAIGGGVLEAVLT